MPKVPIKPFLSLAKSQREEILARMAAKQRMSARPSQETAEGILSRISGRQGELSPRSAMPGAAPHEVTEEIFKYAPPVSRDVSKLTIKHGDPKDFGMNRSEFVDTDVARKAYMENPEGYIPGVGGPKGKHLRVHTASPDDPAYIGQGIGYEQLNVKPIFTNRAEADFMIAKPMAERGGNENHGKIIWQKIIRADKKGGTPAGVVVWKNFLRRSPQKASYHTNAKKFPEKGTAEQQYFQSSLNMYLEDPDRLVKAKRSEELRLLEQIWEQYTNDMP